MQAYLAAGFSKRDRKMNNAIFITEDYLKENTIINGNVDDKYLLASLKMVEDIHIKPVLGSGLYAELKTQVTSGSVTSLNRTLIEEYVQPAMIYWLQVELPVDMVFKWENKSIVRKSSPNSESAAIEDLRWIIDRKDKIARAYTEALTNFLCANAEDYPLYRNYGSGADAVAPIDNINNYGGMYLGNGRRKCHR